MIINPNWLLHVSSPPEIIVDPLLMDKKQFRFPRSGKKRIRNKWAKRPENFRLIPSSKVFKTKDAYICHPSFKKAVEYYLFKQGKMNLPPILMCG